ncbi:MAG: hypothetical protein NDJ90_01465 [Oligoflexia bacterium]|nr:hypothetical protein [Oligoflexia bacterium]
MEANDQEVLLGVLEYNEAKRIQARIEESDGVRLLLKGNPDTCGPGGKCRPRVEVWALTDDLPKVRDFMARERDRDYAGLDVNPELHEEVYDPSKDTARCPACGTTFQTSARECPDCGLVFAVDAAE